MRVKHAGRIGKARIGAVPQSFPFSRALLQLPSLCTSLTSPTLSAFFFYVSLINIIKGGVGLTGTPTKHGAKMKRNPHFTPWNPHGTPLEPTRNPLGTPPVLRPRSCIPRGIERIRTQLFCKAFISSPYSAQLLSMYARSCDSRPPQHLITLASLTLTRTMKEHK